MNTVVALLSLGLVHLFAVASPGPDFIVVFRNSLSSNVKAGLATAFGITTGNCVLLGASVLMASYLSEKNSFFFCSIKIAGALYLAWIGLKCIQAMVEARTKKSGLDSELDGTTSQIQLKSAYLMGLGTTLLNAKALMYYISIVTQFIRADQSLFKNAAMSLMLILVTLFWFSFVAQVSGSKVFKTNLVRRQAKVEGITGIVLLTFGAVMLFKTLVELGLYRLSSF